MRLLRSLQHRLFGDRETGMTANLVALRTSGGHHVLRPVLVLMLMPMLMV